MEHLKRFQAELKEKGVEACVVESPVDLFYLTGLKLSAGALVVTPRSARLFVDGRYAVMARSEARVPVGVLEDEKLALFVKDKRVVFDAGRTSYGRYRALKRVMRVKGVEGVLKGCRGIKDADEVRKLKASANLLWKGFGEIKRCLRAGVTEVEVARRFELFCLEHGGERMGFDPIVAFGEHSAMPHHHVTGRKLKRGDVVLVDIGVVVDGYHSDMTRVVFLGEPKDDVKRLYMLVHGAQQEALKLCKPGVRLGALDEAVREEFRAAGLLKYYPHGLGHGVGLETHEFPRVSHKGADKDVRIEAGMVITVEPGIYLPGKYGVRYEDTIVVTEGGYENFYPNSPVDGTIVR